MKAFLLGIIYIALEDLAKTGPAAKNAKAEQFVELRFPDSLEKSGLLKELYP